MGTVPQLDGNPPQPAGGAGSPAPPNALQQMGGQPTQSSGPDQSVQIVSQHLMEAEQSLRAAARIKPELSGIVDAFVSQVKPQAGQILFGSGQAGQSAPSSVQSGSSLLFGGARSLNPQP